MTGGVVHRAPAPHHCAPGVRWETSTKPDDWGGLPAGNRYAVIGGPWDFPEGTVWECDCGRRWVSRGQVYPNAPGHCEWRREGVLSRLWRAVRNSISVMPSAPSRGPSHRHRE